MVISKGGVFVSRASMLLALYRRGLTLVHIHIRDIVQCHDCVSTCTTDCDCVCLYTKNTHDSGMIHTNSCNCTQTSACIRVSAYHTIPYHTIPLGIGAS